MLRSFPAAAAVLCALALPSCALAGWSAPLTVSDTQSAPAALATDAAGDVAVAWTTVSHRPPSSRERFCALHPSVRSCQLLVAIHLQARSPAGRTLTRTVWQERTADPSATLVIGGGEVTLAWGSYDVSDESETAREVHGPLFGRWSRAGVLGRFYDVGFTGGGLPFYPRLAVARDGLVLAAWSACASPAQCPGAEPGVTLAWRRPGHGFGRRAKVWAAPEGAAPSFDQGGRAYLHSSCSGRVLLARPASHSFDRLVTLTRAPARDLALGLSGAGEGLASWIPSPCSSAELAGPVMASVLRGGRFSAPETIAPTPVSSGVPAALAEDESSSVAVPGGAIVSWSTTIAGGFPTFSSVSLGVAPALPPATRPLAADGAGDIVLGTQQGELQPGPITLLPAGSGPAQPSPARVGQVAVAPFGRGAALAWQEARGPLQLAVWRPQP